MEFLEDIWFWILDFIDDHTRELKIFGITFIIAIIAGVTAYIVIDPIKIKWVGEDINLIATNASSLNYTAVAYNRKASDYEVEYEVTGGQIHTDEEGNLIWELPIEEGTYTITAKHDNVSSSKNITVLGNALINDLALKVEEVLMKDTDNDGLTDNYETTISLTDPNVNDTDGDGIYDGDEVMLGLNPLEPDSKSDGLSDNQRELSYKVEEKNIGIRVDLNGRGNLFSTTIDSYQTETLGNVNAIVTELYAVNTKADLNKANITITYDKNKLSDLGIDENNLAIYELNENDNSFERLETSVNTELSTVSTEVTELGKYFVADKSTLKPSLTTELAFVIDNSGSMYPKEEIADSEENDVNFRRVELSNKLIDKLKGNYKFSAGKFTFEYTNLANMTSDKEEVKNSINTIKTSIENFTGTYIGNAISNSLKQFSDDENINRKYMLLLTDGKDTTGVEGYNGELLKNTIKEAKAKGVKIYTIGLGDVIDKKVLNEIATSTGGKYYFASTAADLDNIFDLISAELNYNLIDTNGDNVDEHVLISDSGFTAKRDGLSFSNFANSSNVYGASYGMSLLAKLYYENNLDPSYKPITIKVGDQVIEAKAAETGFLPINETALYKYSPENLKFFADLPKDFWSTDIQSGTLKIKDEYKSTLGLMLFSIYEQDYTKDTVKFKKYENYMLDIEQINNDELVYDLISITESEVRLLQLINRLDIYRYRDEEFSFIDDNDKAYSKLVEEMENNRPVLLKLNDKYTVLGLKLLADSSNMNKQKIEVYDPNYSGQIKYIEVERIKIAKPEDYNEINSKYEYKFTYQGIKSNVSISIPNLASNL
ncbi:MAG: VWA domain-containing protein [Clostridia bacterium]|nr:VWA domain-containing protein [Clostridia bacterium]